jgi:hypothetical protein
MFIILGYDFGMDLLSWIVIGIIINFALLKNDLLTKKETILAGLTIILVRSVSGGMLSNYIFSDGIARMDFATFTLTGVTPLLILLTANIIDKLENKSVKSRKRAMLIS